MHAAVPWASEVGKPGVGALGVAEQRVARRPRRQRALGRAEHDRHVDVEADRARQRADRDAVADPTDATGRRSRARSRTRDRNRCRVTGSPIGSRWRSRSSADVERSYARYSASGSRSSARAADPSLELFDAPVGPFAPPATCGRDARARRGVRRRTRAVASAGVAPPFAAHAWPEPDVPVVVASDAGLTAGALPAAVGDNAARRIARRHVGEQREQTRAGAGRAGRCRAGRARDAARGARRATCRAARSRGCPAAFRWCSTRRAYGCWRRPQDGDPFERDTRGRRRRARPARRRGPRRRRRSSTRP